MKSLLIVLLGCVLLPANPRAVIARELSHAGMTQITPNPASAHADTTMLMGSGLNMTGGPIDRLDVGGVWRKERGERTWRFLPSIPSRNRDHSYQRELDTLLRLHGAEMREVIVVIRDSTDAALLRSFHAHIGQAQPCTVSVRVQYRQLVQMHKAGLHFWNTGQQPLLSAPIQRGAAPSEPHVPGRTLPSSLRQRPPGATAADSAEAALSCPQALPFFDGFENCGVPSESWIAYEGPNGSSAKWGDLSSDYAHVRAGTWSVSAAGAGDQPVANGYEMGEDTQMDNPSYFDMSAYSQYTISYWVYYDILTQDSFDWFYSNESDIYTQNGHYTGTSNGWLQRTLVFPNTNHLYDHVKMRFSFFSAFDDNTGKQGVYIDDVSITGVLFQPNLTNYTRPGTAGPIIPSSVTGTVISTALYAGQPVYVDWSIQNNGAGSANGFYVDYYLDNSYINSDWVATLPSGSTFTHSDWPYTVPTAGTHTLKMIADGTGNISESSESDNAYQDTFSWSTALPPDVIVQSVVPSTSAPGVGQSMSVTVTIKNQGSGLANQTFYTDFYKNLGAPPVAGQLPIDDEHSTFSLAAGATITYTISGLTSSTATTWNMYAYVDRSNALNEGSAANENNNVSAVATVHWTASLISPSGTVAYDDASYCPGVVNGTNHPMGGVRVDLFDSDQGQGTTDDLLATTVTDINGHFSFASLVNQDTDADQGRLDLYVKTSLVSNEAPPAITLTDDIPPVGVMWTWSSLPARTDDATGSFGTIKPPDYAHRSAFHLYDVLKKGYAWAIGQGLQGRHPLPLVAFWRVGLPYTSAYHADSQTMGINGTPDNNSNPDEWDDSVILHEYAHNIAHAFDFHPNLPCNHDPRDVLECPPGTRSPALAFQEAWADFGGLIMTGSTTGTFRDVGVNTTYSSPTVVETQYETGDAVRNGTNIGNRNAAGWMNQITVGGVFWDLFDGVPDNQDGLGCGDIGQVAVGQIFGELANPVQRPMATLQDFYARYYDEILIRDPLATASPTTKAIVDAAFCEHGLTPVGAGLTAVSGGTAGAIGVTVIPTPARGAVSIRYSVQAAADVDVGVFDVSGRLVRTLERGHLAPSQRLLTWDGVADDGERLHSGVYFCRARVGSRTEDATILLLR
jgi:CARDB/FlgD Ig-like domain